jgi:hypothetical protein
MSRSTSEQGSFILRASLYKGANPLQPNPNPELYNSNEFIYQPINLRGTYKLTIKYILNIVNRATNGGAAPGFPADFGYNPYVFFVSPNTVNYATNDANNLGYSQLQGASNNNSLGDSFEHEVIAQIDGSLKWNLVWNNCFYGIDPKYTIDPLNPYAAGMRSTPGVQPYFNGPITWACVSVFINWKKI